MAGTRTATGSVHQHVWPDSCPADRWVPPRGALDRVDVGQPVGDVRPTGVNRGSVIARTRTWQRPGRARSSEGDRPQRLAPLAASSRARQSASARADRSRRLTGGRPSTRRPPSPPSRTRSAPSSQPSDPPRWTAARPHKRDDERDRVEEVAVAVLEPAAAVVQERRDQHGRAPRRRATRPRTDASPPVRRAAGPDYVSRTDSPRPSGRKNGNAGIGAGRWTRK